MTWMCGREGNREQDPSLAGRGSMTPVCAVPRLVFVAMSRLKYSFKVYGIPDFDYTAKIDAFLKGSVFEGFMRVQVTFFSEELKTRWQDMADRFAKIHSSTKHTCGKSLAKL